MHEKKDFVTFRVALLILIFLAIGICNASTTKIRVKVDSAKLRFKASAASAVVADLKKGQFFESIKKEGEWYHLTFTDNKTGFSITGFIHQNDVEIIDGNSVEKTGANVAEKKGAIISSDTPRSSEVRAPEYLRYATSNKITYTTTDIRYEYEILGILTHEEDIAGFGFKDPLVEAINKGMKKYDEKVVKMGGDAVVGLHYNYTSRTEKDQGRLIIYGTVVKFR